MNNLTRLLIGGASLLLLVAGDTPILRASTPTPACRWQTVPAPSLGPDSSGITFDFLNSASSAGPDSVWFGGTYAATQAEGFGFNIELLNWNGTSVQVIPHPHPGVNDLRGPVSLSFDSPSDGWVTANYGTDFSVFDLGHYATEPLAMHWDGKTWESVPVDNDGRVFASSDGTLIGDSLEAVKAISPTDAWAVGVSGTDLGGGGGSLIEHWDGAQWSVVNQPTTNAPGAVLRGIGGSSASDLWAVGFMPTTDQLHTVPLVEHWDGSAWSVIPAPLPAGTTDAALHAVAADSATDSWAVGETIVNNQLVDVIEHWDGKSWSVVAGDPNAPSGAILRSVVAFSPGDAWIAGIGFGGGQLQHWDGEKWSLAGLPGPRELRSIDGYAGLAGASGSDVWAGGEVDHPFLASVFNEVAHLSCSS